VTCAAAVDLIVRAAVSEMRLPRHRLGDAEMCGLPSLWSRVDLTGAALLIGDRRVVEIAPDAITVKTESGVQQKFYRALGA
jgi:hypothetical protein